MIVIFFVTAITGFVGSSFQIQEHDEARGEETTLTGLSKYLSPTQNVKFQLGGELEPQDPINGSALVTRTITAGSFGIVTVVDSIEIQFNSTNGSRESVDYLVPADYAQDLGSIEFRTSLTSFSGSSDADSENSTEVQASSKSYVFAEVNDFRVFRVALIDENGTNLDIVNASSLYLEVTSEYVRPYTHYIDFRNQVLIYTGFLTALINGIPTASGSITTFTRENTRDSIILPPDQQILPDTFLPTNDTSMVEWLDVNHTAVDVFENDSIDLTDMHVELHLEQPGIASNTRVEPGTVLISSTHVTKRIEIDSFGKIRVEESYTIVNYGAGEPEGIIASQKASHAIQTLNINVPTNASVTGVWDDVGKINDRSENLNDLVGDNVQFDRENREHITVESPEEGYNYLPVEFRVPIYGGQSYNFSFSYEVSSDEQLIEQNGTIINEFTFPFDLIGPIRWTVDELEVTLTLPTGSGLSGIDLSKPYSDTNVSLISFETFTQWKTAFLGRERSVKFATHSLLPSSDLKVTVTYSVAIWDRLAPAYAFGLITLAAFGLFISSSYWKRFAFLTSKLSIKEVGTGEVKSEIPHLEIHRYLEASEEYEAIQLEIENLERRIRGRGVSQKSGKASLRKLRVRRKEQLGVRDAARVALITASGRYESIVGKIEETEALTLTTKQTINATNKEYRRGKGVMSKKVYQDVLLKHQRELKKYQQDQQKYIQQLRDQSHQP